MKRLIAASIASTFLAVILPMALVNCSAEATPEAIAVGAAFTNLGEVGVYDRHGRLVASLDPADPTAAAEVTPGTYYLDLLDDAGGSVFGDDGQLRFAPHVTGAELELQPTAIAGFDHPLLPLHVGLPEDARQQGLIDAADSTHADAADAERTKRYDAFGGNRHWMRIRVVWEAARAMVGPSAANYHVWPTSTTNARHRYPSEDLGAWTSLRQAYGRNLSCRADSNALNLYPPCNLTYGSAEPSAYEVQNGWYKGGQCKAFVNLVIYRSGVYHGDSWGFRTLPSDDRIPALADAPLAKPGTLEAGDVLRMPYGHAAIVVRVLDANQAVVIDSNWMGGNGWENTATHVMGFSGYGASNLGNYYRLNCVYDGSC
jgi:hypothetical protein